MSRRLAQPLVFAALAALGACGTARPAPERRAPVLECVAGTPTEALDRIRSAAQAHGWRVADEGAGSVVVDFGVRTARIPVQAADGRWDARAVPRLTEVHASARFAVNAADAGTVVAIWREPTYWHPDLRCWLPGPFDASPGEELLRDLAGTQ